MTTTVVRPVDPSLQSALRLASAFSAAVLLFHVMANLWQTHIGYGYFRDEMYYVVCGRRLAWGYVDHGPLVAVQARLAETLFGRSLTGIRMLSSVAGALRTGLTGILAWSLGGRRSAQGIAMVAVSLAPIYLGTDGVLAMNSFEALFWMLCLLALILLERGGPEKLWLLFGISAGLGLLNKPSMAFFLLALVLALLVTEARKLLKMRSALAGVALLFAIALPNLLWQIANHWPTLEFLRQGQIEHKNKALNLVSFLVTQMSDFNPLAILLWGAGLVWLLRTKKWRWLGLTYLFFLSIMFALHSKDYYVAPIYPVLFAAGGVAWETWRARRPSVQRGSLIAFPILTSVLVATGLLLLPMSTPILRPQQWITYAKTLHLYEHSGNSENQASGELPQFYADRFGWQEEVDQLSRIVDGLSPQDRADALIKCDNYGEASAVVFLGRDLPPAVSGHNNYFLWGPGPDPTAGRVLLVVERTTPEHLKLFYSDVTLVGRMGVRYSMPQENRPIYLLRGPRQDLASIWPDTKHFD